MQPQPAELPVFVPPARALAGLSALHGPRRPAPGSGLRWLLSAMALLTTGVALTLAAAAAWERGGSGPDRWLLTAGALMLALGAQLLPALARRQPWAWLLWLGCLLATLYGHAHFFAASSLRAGAQRADAVSESRQQQAWRAELAAIQARPLAVVAADQARLEGLQARTEASWQRCERLSPSACPSTAAALASARSRAQANAVELAEAHQAAALRSRLTEAAAAQDSARAAARQNPVDRALAELSGLPLGSFGLVSSLAQSLLLELLAALLWVLACTAGTQARPAHPPLTQNADLGVKPPARGCEQSGSAAWVRLPAPIGPQALPPSPSSIAAPRAAASNASTRRRRVGNDAPMQATLFASPGESEPDQTSTAAPEALDPAPLQRTNQDRPLSQAPRHLHLACELQATLFANSRVRSAA